MRGKIFETYVQVDHLHLQVDHMFVKKSLTSQVE